MALHRTVVDQEAALRKEQARSGEAARWKRTVVQLCQSLHQLSL